MKETNDKTAKKASDSEALSKANVKREMTGGLCLVFGVWIAATSGLFVRTTDVGAASVAFYRAALSMPVFAIVYCFVMKSLPQKPGKALKLIVFTGLGGAVIGPLYHMAYRYTTIANVELIVNMIPFIVIPLSWLLYRERITLNFFFALLIAVLGLFILLSGKVETSAENLLGDLMAGVTCVAYAVYVMLLARIRSYLSGVDTMFYIQLAFSTLLIPVIIALGEQWMPGSWSSFASLVGVALFTNLIGMGCIILGLGMVNVSLGAVIIMTQPVAGAVYGAAFMGETLSTMELVGIAICIVGVIYANIATSKAREAAAKEVAAKAAKEAA